MPPFQNAASAKHVRMRLARADILGEETLVEMERDVDLLHDLGGPGLETPAPHRVGHVCVRLGALVRSMSYKCL